MEFFENYKMKQISKTVIEKFLSCQQYAYYYVRDPIKEEDLGSAAQMGKAIHELSLKKLADLNNDKYNIQYNEKYNNIPDPEIWVEARKLVDEKVNMQQFLTGDTKVLGYKEKIETTLPSGINISVIIDFILLRNMNGKKVIEFVDIKTGWKVEEYIGLQGIISAYLLSSIKEFEGLDIIATKYYVKKNKIARTLIPFEEALSYGDIIDQDANIMKKILDSNEIPIAKAGEQCANCRYYDICSLKDLEETTPDDVINKYIYHTETASIYKKRLEEMAKQDKEGEVKNSLGVDCSFHTSFATTFKKKSGKKLFLDDLIKSDRIKDFADYIKIEKMNDVLIAEAEKLGYVIEQSPKNNFKIVYSTKEENDSDEEKKE